MHEFSIASSIVESLLDLANKQGASKVLEVHLKVGQLRALSTEQLTFSYHVLAKGTILDGSRLIVKESAGIVRCPGCNYHGGFNTDGASLHFGIPVLICPECGTGLNVEGGDECVITQARMVLPTHAGSQASAPVRG